MPKTIKRAPKKASKKTSKKVARKTSAAAKGAAKKKAAGAKKTPAKKRASATTRTPKGPKAPKAQRTSRASSAAKKTPAKTSRKAPATKKKAGARMTAQRDNTAASGIRPYKKRKGEKYMSRKQLEHFRKLMIAWKEDLMHEVDRTVVHMKADSSNYADSADRATQEEGFSLELRERDRERKLIRKIDEALIRIDNNEYGYCELCGIEIGISRLEARPTATMCIDCKTLDEIKEKQVASL